MGFSNVTELPEEVVPEEQLDRIKERYLWAAEKVTGKIVLECACGAAQGAKLLNSRAELYIACDIDKELVGLARGNNNGIDIQISDASNMSFESEMFDVVLICEAIYYMPDINKFLSEVHRVLRPNGKVLIVTANKDLFDFHPSPMTTIYPGVLEIADLFKKHEFEFISVEGGTNVSGISIRQKVLRPIKLIASKMNLIPKTMGGKSWLKKLFFGGEFVPMPSSFDVNISSKGEPQAIPTDQLNRDYKVLYFIGEKK